MISDACFNASDDFISPSAAITLARASRDASASVAIARCSDVGSDTSLLLELKAKTSECVSLSLSLSLALLVSPYVDVVRLPTFQHVQPWRPMDRLRHPATIALYGRSPRDPLAARRGFAFPAHCGAWWLLANVLNGYNWRPTHKPERIFIILLYESIEP